MVAPRFAVVEHQIRFVLRVEEAQNALEIENFCGVDDYKKEQNNIRTEQRHHS